MKDLNKLNGAVLIVGCARNIAKYVEHVIFEMHRIGKLFTDYKILIYENDSNDKTLSLLKKKEDKDLTIISEVNVPGCRTLRLAHGRNILLQKARDSADKFRWLIIMDMDFGNPIDLNGIDKAIKSWDILRWNACTAVTKTYYDFWALRVPGYMDYDCMNDKNNIIKYGKCKEYKYKFQPKNITWVKSAFNGLAIHSMDSIAKSNCKYEGLNNLGKDVCEHVSFYEGLGRVIIHPDLIAQTWTMSLIDMVYPISIIGIVIILIILIIVIILIVVKIKNKERL